MTGTSTATNGTTNGNDWQGMTTTGTSDHFGWFFFFFFFQIREELIIKYPKDNSLIIEEDLWWRAIELTIETSP